VNRHQREIDQRPFRSKDESAREDALRAQYRRLAIPEVVAALEQKTAAVRHSETD
jgi:hypothetical protein